MEEVSIDEEKEYEKKSIKDISINMNWAFGFRNKNTNHPLYFIKSQNNKKSTEKYVYYIAKVVVIYFPKLNIQKHYLEHEVNFLYYNLFFKNEVLSIAISTTNLIASSEYGS